MNPIAKLHIDGTPCTVESLTTAVLGCARTIDHEPVELLSGMLLITVLRELPDERADVVNQCRPILERGWQKYKRNRRVDGS